jgi:hypothetical protein
MALADVASRLTNDVPHKTCTTCHYMAERGDEWAETLRSLLRNRSIRFKDIADELYNDPDEPTIPWKSLSRHANRGCSAQEQLR